MTPNDFATFSFPGLDRAAHLRSDMGALLANPLTRAIVLWRGKPLVSVAQSKALAQLALDHPILSEAKVSPVFLGLAGTTPLLAYDISPWEAPDIDPEAMANFFDPTQNHHPDAAEDDWFVELRGVMTELTPQDANIAATARALFAWHNSHPHCARCGAKNSISDGGWRADCAACNAQHFPRTDPVIIALVTSGDDVLLGRSPMWPPGMYSLLAGFVEPGETIEAATAREVFEESAITLDKVHYVTSQPWPYPASLMFGTKAEATTREITIDPNEIEDAMWVSKARLKVAMQGEDETLKPARPGSIARYMLDLWAAGEI